MISIKRNIIIAVNPFMVVQRTISGLEDFETANLFTVDTLTLKSNNLFVTHERSH